MLKREDFTHPQVEFTSEAEKRLQECIEFVNAKRPDLEENLKFQFHRHDEYFRSHPDIRMKVFVDFAPLSFYFEVYYLNRHHQRYELDYNGGIIFHGDHDGWGNGGSPTYAVCIQPVDGWSTHT